MYFVAGTDKNLAFRYFSPDRWYDLKFDSANYSVGYQQLPHSGDYTSVIFPLPNGNTYHIKVVVKAGQITTYINNSLVLDKIFDPVTEFSPEGILALQASVGEDPISEVYFDNIVVVGEDPTPSPTVNPTTTPTASPTASPTATPSASPTASPTPSPTATPSPSATPVATNSAFPIFTQTNSSWSGAIYDSANLWNPLDPSFGRWGCAVTSAAMILKYYGISTLPNGLGTTPGNLNLWLKQTPGGYVGDGLLNWTMISKISQIMRLTTPFGTKLEYSWGPGSVPLLTEELTSGRPTILQATLGHFVTAYQMGSANNIDIVDPYFPKTSLAQYGGTFVSMRKFAPSHTDLSHITLYLSGSADIDLLKRDGRRVKELSPAVYTEELWGQPGNQRSGSTSQVMDLAKPDSGRYRIRISKNTPKKLKYTLILTTKDGDQKILRGDVLAGRRPTYLDFNFFKIKSGDCFFEGLHDD